MAAYEGTRYICGGENRFGIDCSGLVRKGLVNALFAEAGQHHSLRFLREAISLWWHDTTARDFPIGYGGRTTSAFTARSINAMDESSLFPGALAVTEDGIHVLAFLGDGEWIQADSYAGRVV